MSQLCRSSLAGRVYTLVLIALGVMFSNPTSAQHKCASHQHRMERAAQNPIYAQHLLNAESEFQKASSRSSFKRREDLITIPVVVHVVYNASEENVSEAQIQSQLDVLNADFQLLNDDKLSSTHAFFDDAANCEIEFCLAKTDPDGNPHSGITRTRTDSVNFAGVGNEKFASEGGHDNWDPYRYLNIWVCNLDEDFGTLGYSSFPTDLKDYPGEDGVVIHYRCFGTTGTAGTGDFQENDLGRTATHEVGHWLYLEHIWGDEECGTDNVSDTPPQEWDNGGCPDFPRNANNQCGSDGDGEMFMNYMDYVDDACMVMFTNGQRKRMRDAIATHRPKLLDNAACSTVSINGSILEKEVQVNVYPNPTEGVFTLDIKGLENYKADITIFSLLGETVYHSSINMKNEDVSQVVDLSSLAYGMYTLVLTNGNRNFTQQIAISK